MNGGGVVIRTASGRTAGVVSGTILWRELSASKHQLRRPPAWAIDLAALDAAERAGATHCTTVDRDSGLVYRCSLTTWRARGFRFNRGYGEQLGLELRHWRVSGGGAARQLSAEVQA